MSRSYKKNPVSKSCPDDGTYGKRQANKKIRRFKGELSDGKEYKKLYCSWNIHDSTIRYTLNEALEFRTKMISDCAAGRWTYHAQHDEKYFNIHKCIKHWKKFYYWK